MDQLVANTLVGRFLQHNQHFRLFWVPPLTTQAGRVEAVWLNEAEAPLWSILLEVASVWPTSCMRAYKCSYGGPVPFFYNIIPSEKQKLFSSFP